MLKGHIKVCKMRYQAEAETLPQLSLADEDDCGVDDTVSNLSKHYPLSDDDKENEVPQVGQIRPPLQSSQELKKEVEKKVPVPRMECISAIV